MRQFLYIAFILFQTNSVGQNKLSFNVNNDSLKNLGIDTFFVFRVYCVGCSKITTVNRNDTDEEIYEKNCELNEPFYIFYIQNSRTYVKKTNNCVNYKPISIDSSKAFPYFLKNFNELLSENILTNSYISEKGDTLKMYSNHTDCTEMYLSCGLTKELKVDQFDFSKHSLQDQTNICYNHNIKTKFHLLRKLTFEDLKNVKFIKN